MNLPNKLTLLRVIMIPLLVVFLLVPAFRSFGDYAAFAVFLLASITDMLDGYIARKYNMITNFGKFMDPLADKLLVCSAMICLIEMGRIPSWVVVIIISREFIISGFRLIASERGFVIAANIFGKIKTVCQMIMILMLILYFDNDIYRICCQVLIIISVVLTVLSLVIYMWQNRSVLSEGK